MHIGIGCILIFHESFFVTINLKVEVITVLITDSVTFQNG